jgi:hypothetical protein
MHPTPSAHPTRPPAPAGARAATLLRRAVLAAAVAWLGWGFAAETRHSLAALAAPPRPGDVMFWRLGDRQHLPLRGFLAEVDRLVPAGAVVVFATDAGDAGQDFFLRQWAAYLLPRQRVIPLAHPRAAQVADYLVAWGTAVDHPRLTEVLRRPGGVL